MRIMNYFLVALIVSAGAFSGDFVQAQSSLKIEHKRLSAPTRGAGDRTGQSSKIEKPFYFKNKCDARIRLVVIYLNTSGRHRLKISLAAGQSGTSKKAIFKAHTVVKGACKKTSGRGKCIPYIDAKAWKWKVRACK